jgi:hypothetical protein
MEFQTTLFALLAFFALNTSAATFNKKLSVWNIGKVPSVPGFPGTPTPVWGKCGGIPNGGHVCGSFGPGKKAAMRAIYTCHDGTLNISELCMESSENNHCVLNGRKPGQRFYPLVSGDKIVFVPKSRLKET